MCHDHRLNRASELGSSESLSIGDVASTYLHLQRSSGQREADIVGCHAAWSSNAR